MIKKLLLILLTLVIYFAVSCTCNYNPFTPYEITATDSLSVTLVSPINGATNQDTIITLSWSGNAETYDVYLGTDSTSLIKIISTDSTNCIKSGLSEGTKYYWKVIGKKGSESDTSGVRSFTTRISVSLISPANGATNQDTSVALSWSGTAETYDVYLGTDSTSLIKIISTDSTNCIKSGLSEGTKYYWKVIGKKGSESDTSGVRSFTTRISVSLTSPANGATEQSTDLTFSWSGNAETYDVYLGTDSTSLSKIANNLTATTYTKNGLDEITTYYWKVVGTKGSDSDTSGVRKFITKLNLNLEMVTVEAGTFQMGIGSAVPTDTAHYVTISKTFDIGKYEITNAQVVRVYNLAKKKGISGLSFDSIAVTYNGNPILDLKAGACYIGYSASSDTLYVEGDKGQFPVTVISWNGATAFAEFMNNLSGTDKYRLPTEAEWEFAARGGKNSNSYIYAGSNTIGDVAWYSANSATTDNIPSGWRINPVGQKNANELGIYDMSGNVSEWCSDWYGNYSSSSQTDPTGASSGTKRVWRGGSWNQAEDVCRVYFRDSSDPTTTTTMMGFRLVRSK